MRKKPWSGMRKPKKWERLAKEYGLSHGQIENMI